MNRRFARGRIKHVKGVMNKTEFEYSQHLELKKQAGEIIWYSYEAIKLRLAKNTTYTPDFLVMLADGTLQAHEVKGFWEDDAKVKIKVAAEMFPFEFIAITRQPKKLGGDWNREEFL